MNHVFSLIWNPASQSYCPAPENARSRVKGRHRKLALALAIAAASSGVQAAPAGGNVVDGNALINTTGTATVINQTSDAVTINWLDFDIDANESVTFVQPDSNSLALNRVLTGNGTEIQGQLNANGRVFILDANGVLFGQNAQVNVGSLVASTLDLSSSDLANNHFEFSGNGSPAAVVNLGQITAANSGTVALLGGQVSNQGIIRARLGKVALAAGNQITLDFAGDGLLNVQIDEGTVSALANNGGLIQADGGSVLMTAQASDALLQTVVNNTGVIEAHTLQEQDGKIMLLGGFNGGSVNVSGTLDASAPDGGNGGFIETSGAIVNLNSDLQVTTASVDGQTGNWLIDPMDLSISYVGANDGTSHLSTQALQNNLATTNVTVQTQAAGAQPGNITVVDPIIWASANRLTLDAHNNIAFNDYLHAPNGGLELDAGGTISTGAEGHINVAAFTLTDGDWSQVAATLPKFTADDFTLSGGTFTRATGGDGTGGSPLQIADIYGLQGLDTTPTLNAVLVNDIDASGTASWNAGAGFNPIGNTAATPYNASFNGQGHVISGLTINRPTEVYVGLFGYTGNTANIERTGLTDVSITGQFYVGGIAGRNSGAISNSFLTGTITGEAYVGGFSGVNYGTINNSYSTGAITGESFVGGLTGTNSGAINTSYVSGKVTLGGGAFSGGIISGANGGTVSNSYWDTFTTGQATSSGGSAINGNWAGAENAYNQATYAGFDFTNDWFIAEGSSRPMLRAFLDGGNISNLYQLQGMSADLAGAYTLIKNIDASATAASVTAGNGGNFSDVWGGRGFAPVGTNANPFTGSLDGQDFVIDDLTINRPDQSWVGLFGAISDANIHNLGLTNLSVIGGGDAGGLAGYAIVNNAMTISVDQVYAQGSVSALGGSAFSAGGLIGRSISLGGVTTLSNSYTEVTVSAPTATAAVGGLAGSFAGNITSSYATGSVQGDDSVGGLVGTLFGNITDSYASGAVSGNSNTGGLVGNLNAGGVTTSYWDSFTTGQATSAGGAAVNGNWAGAEDAYNQASYVGFDFGSDWFIAEGSSRPMLRAFLDGGNIGNLYQLQGMAANLAGNYTLTTNIDAAATATSIASGNFADVWGGRGFAPVGNLAGAFTGSFNGNGFTISNLDIARGDQDAVGLFGSTGAAASIQNARLNAVDILGNNSVGGLVGTNQGSISGSAMSGDVEANITDAGGLAGVSSGSISGSYADVDVTSAGVSGGLAGYVTGSINTSYALGDAVGTGRTGGLVGHLNGVSATINQSYALGAASGGAAIGGLAGDASGGSTITNSFWNSSLNALATAMGTPPSATGLTTAQFGNIANFASWGASINNTGGGGSVWRLYEGHNSPLLRSFLTPITVTAYNDTKTFDGNAYAGLHNINGTRGNGVRYGTNYAQFLAAFGENGTPYSGADKLGTTDLKYAGTAQGAINAGAYTLTPTALWSTQPGYDIVTTNGALTIDPASVNITVSVDDASKIYGNSDPVFNWGITSGSLFGGDTLTGTLSRDAGENVGNYTIYGTPTGDLTNGNYLVTVNNGVFTINPRLVEISVGNSGKIYGDVDPGFTWSLTSGNMANGDTAEVSLTRAAGENVGNYAIAPTLSGALTSGNYTVTTSNGSLTISPRAITLGVADASKIYGEIDPALSWEMTSGSMASGETATVNLTRTAGENAGSYAITPSASGALASGNYTVTIDNGLLTISPRAITIGMADASKIYGEIDPALSWEMTSGSMAFDETATVNLTRTAGENAGSYAITPSASGALASGNYTVTIDNGLLTISPRAITIGVADASKIYGEIDPALSWEMTSGSMAFGETAAVDLTRAAGENVGNYDIAPNLSGALGSSNYTVTIDNGLLTISPRAIAIGVADASKIYGEIDPTLSWEMTSGSMAFGETAAVDLTRTAGENVGNYDIAPNLSGALDTNNYTVTIDNGALTITPRALVIDIASFDKTYGDADPTFTWAITSGSLAANDELSGVLSRVASENVGSYTIKGAVDGDLANGNYAYTINNGQLTINPRPLVLTADSLMKIYGAEDPALTWRISSGTLVEGDNLLVNISRADGSNVGTYSISLNAGGTATNSTVNNNYALTLEDGQLQITPAPLTVTANDVTSYWDLMPAFTASVAGLVNGDTETSVFGSSISVLSNLSLPLPGDYRLTPTANQIGQNYQVSYVDGLLNLLSSNPGGNYIDALTSTQLPAREALGRELRANIYEGRPLLDGSEDGIVLQVLDGGVKLDPDTLAAWGIEFPQAVLFPTNSANVGQHYLAELRKFVAQLQRYPDVQVLVEGHSSSTGSLALNQRLSNERAKSVAQVLNSLGLEADRIRTENLDYQFPVASNLTEEGRLKNQRAVVLEDSITQ